MRGILFPNVNVIYAAQNDDPAKTKPADDPSTSPNPLTSMFGGWQAVEDSGLALAESLDSSRFPGGCARMESRFPYRTRTGSSSFKAFGRLD